MDRSVLDALPFSIVITNHVGRIVRTNPAADALLGHGPGELAGLLLAAIDGLPRPTCDDGRLDVRAGVGAEVERIYRHRDGTLIPVRETIMALAIDVSRAPEFLVVAYGTARRVEDRDGTGQLATHDSLTNLPNQVMSAALGRALERVDDPDQHELSIAYQPQLDLATGQVVGLEALARWTSPTLGAVAPDQFIPVAEDGGMIVQLGGWVLRTACAALAAVQQELGRPLRLAVNVSPRQMRGAAWLEEIAEAIASAGIAPHQLEVEITERLLIDDRGDTVEMLQSLRDLGVTIAIDDFGRGYSSLAYLTRFPINKIKIDRSFISAITCIENDAAIVDAIIVLAHALGMTVVAEGVETLVQEQYLRQRGCDEVQGYRYSPGVAPDAVATVVRVLSD